MGVKGFGQTALSLVPMDTDVLFETSLKERKERLSSLW